MDEGVIHQFRIVSSGSHYDYNQKSVMGVDTIQMSKYENDNLIIDIVAKSDIESNPISNLLMTGSVKQLSLGQVSDTNVNEKPKSTKNVHQKGLIHGDYYKVRHHKNMGFRVVGITEQMSLQNMQKNLSKLTQNRFKKSKKLKYKNLGKSIVIKKLENERSKKMMITTGNKDLNDVVVLPDLKCENKQLMVSQQMATLVKMSSLNQEDLEEPKNDEIFIILNTDNQHDLLDGAQKNFELSNANEETQRIREQASFGGNLNKNELKAFAIRKQQTHMPVKSELGSPRVVLQKHKSLGGFNRNKKVEMYKTQPIKNPELAISQRRISANKSSLNKVRSRAPPAINITGTQEENGDSMIKLVDLDQYLHRSSQKSLRNETPQLYSRNFLSRSNNASSKQNIQQNNSIVNSPTELDAKFEEAQSAHDPREIQVLGTSIKKQSEPQSRSSSVKKIGPPSRKIIKPEKRDQISEASTLKRSSLIENAKLRHSNQNSSQFILQTTLMQAELGIPQNGPQDDLQKVMMSQDTIIKIQSTDEQQLSSKEVNQYSTKRDFSESADEEVMRPSIIAQEPQVKSDSTEEFHSKNVNVGTDMLLENLEVEMFVDPIQVKMREEDMFASYLESLNEYQKLQLYKQQLEEAISLQVMPEPIIDHEQIRKQNISTALAGQLLPRIIINNALGQNKVIYIDPFKGKSQDLHQKILKKQKGLKVAGESVTILKGTGPGAAMAIPSVPQQIAMMHSAAMEEKLQDARKQSTSSNGLQNQMYNIRVTTSTAQVGQLRQLLCDTVTKTPDRGVRQQLDSSVQGGKSSGRLVQEISPIRISRIRETKNQMLSNDETVLTQPFNISHLQCEEEEVYMKPVVKNKDTLKLEYSTNTIIREPSRYLQSRMKQDIRPPAPLTPTAVSDFSGFSVKKQAKNGDRYYYVNQQLEQNQFQKFRERMMLESVPKKKSPEASTVRMEHIYSPQNNEFNIVIKKNPFQRKTSGLITKISSEIRRAINPVKNKNHLCPGIPSARRDSAIGTLPLHSKRQGSECEESRLYHTNFQRINNSTFNIKNIDQMTVPKRNTMMTQKTMTDKTVIAGSNSHQKEITLMPNNTLVPTIMDLHNSVSPQEIVELESEERAQEKLLTEIIDAPSRLDQTFSSFQNAQLSRDNSLEGFSVPKPSILGDLRKIYNPNFHSKLLKNQVNLNQSCAYEFYKQNVYECTSAERLSDEKSFFPKSPLSTQPVFNKRFTEENQKTEGTFRNITRESVCSARKLAQKTSKLQFRYDNQYFGTNHRNSQYAKSALSKPMQVLDIRSKKGLRIQQAAYNKIKKGRVALQNDVRISNGIKVNV